MKDIGFLFVEALKGILRYIIANGQTVRWATQKKVLSKFLHRFKVDVSLDVGCGGGTYAIELLALISTKVIALELEHSLAQLATRRVAHRELVNKIMVIRGNAYALPVASKSVDLVLVSEVLEHLERPEDAIKEFFRVLKNGSALVVTVPYPPEPFHNPGHMHEGFNENELFRLLQEGGFTMLRWQFCMFMLTRFVLKCCSVLKIPLPLVPICYFEQITSRWWDWGNPYDLVVLARKHTSKL